MAIVNVTPDSFADGGERFDPDVAIADATQMVADGADILDIGGESTRPGAGTLPEAEEWRRVAPVLEGVRGLGVPISIDTYKASIADRAIDLGASIVNDISALVYDPRARGGRRAPRRGADPDAQPRTVARDVRRSEVHGRRRRSDRRTGGARRRRRTRRHPPRSAARRSRPRLREARRAHLGGTRGVAAARGAGTADCVGPVAEVVPQDRGRRRPAGRTRCGGRPRR